MHIKPILLWNQHFISFKQTLYTAMDQPWIEKYRPKTLKDVSSQSTTTKILEKSLNTANLPHMLFYGPPGTGKTSTILAMARQLYGPNLMSSRVLELNASDERGISIVRDRIKNFARLAITNPSKEDLQNYPCPPYKLIILDEADSMTMDAQSALRRTMETYAKVTRFCIICNYVTKIIDPLASRCSKFRFRPLDENSAIERLNFIANSENISINNNLIIDILNVCEGDLRRAVNLLQSVSTILKNNQSIDIKTMFGYLPDSIINNLIDLLKLKNLNKITTFTENEIIKNGYSASFLLISLHKNLLLNSNLSSIEKNKISQILYKSDSLISIGCNENIQIINCLYNLSKVL